MKDTDQIIALAEWLGWDTEKKQLGGVYCYYDSKGSMWPSLPRFPSSLDALKPAIEKMIALGFYVRITWTATGEPFCNIGGNGMSPRIRATGLTPELAIMEAILKSQGLWRDG